MRKPPPNKDTTLSHAVRAPTYLRTYGDVLEYIKGLPPAQQKKAHWLEIRDLLTSDKLWTKAHLTRLVERAANKDAE